MLVAKLESESGLLTETITEIASGSSTLIPGLVTQEAPSGSLGSAVCVEGRGRLLVKLIQEPVAGNFQ